MLYRPETWQHVYGQASLVAYLQERVREGNLPHFIIFVGEEGLGKTTLAKLCAVSLSGEGEKAIEAVIRNNKDTKNIKTFKMSVDGGKDAVLTLLAEYNNSAFVAEGKAKVLIADEAQNMTRQAYDALLSDTEYPQDNVYLFMCTTDFNSIPKTLQSRAVIRWLERLSRQDMHRLLRDTMLMRGLTIQHMDIAFDIITTYAENKPRTALQVIEAMGENRAVQLAEIKGYVRFREPDEWIPIIKSLEASLINGVTDILRVNVDDRTQESLCDILTECIRLRHGMSVTKYNIELLKEATDAVGTDLLVKFLHEVSNLTVVSTSSLVSAFLNSTPNFEGLQDHSVFSLNNETNVMRGRSDNLREASGIDKPAEASTVDDMFRHAKKIVETE